MKEGINIQVNGFKELEEIFMKLPSEIALGAGRDGVRAGAKIVLEEAKKLVPVKTGGLRDSLVVQQVKARFPVFKVLASRKNGKKGFHAHLIELGTKAHKIKPKNKNGVLLLHGGIIAHEVDHKGSKKQPFLRPALSGKKEEVIKVTGEKIIIAVKKRLKKYLK